MDPFSGGTDPVSLENVAQRKSRKDQGKTLSGTAFPLGKNIFCLGLPKPKRQAAQQAQI
jgi:hypothetical protein